MNGSSGDLLGRFPYVRAGSGPRTLVVVPGIYDAMFGDRYPPPLRWGIFWFSPRYVDDYSIYLVSRPRHLPADPDIDEMADGYVEVLSAALGPADALGVSMGGMIAQALAARHGGLVERIVLEAAESDDSQRRYVVGPWKAFVYLGYVVPDRVRNRLFGVLKRYL